MKISRVQVQKIYSTPHFIAMVLRGKDTQVLYIGRGQDYCGFFLDSIKPDANMRIVERGLEYLRKELKNRIVNIKLSDNSIEIQKEESALTMHYLNKKLIIGSVGKGEQVFNLKLKNYEDYKKNYTEITSKIEKKTIDIQEKKLKRKIENIKNDIEKNLKIISLKKILISNHDFVGEDYVFEYGKMKIKFNSGDSKYKRREKIINKIKQYEKGNEILIRRLEASKKKEVEKLKKVEYIPIDIDTARKKEKVKESVKNQKRDFKIYNYNKIKIWVGSSTLGNDQIREIVKNKKYIWFHAYQEKSAHVIIEKERSELKVDDYSLIGSLILDLMSRNSFGSEIDLVYTELGNIKGVKGRQGAVTYKKEKMIRVIYSDTYKEKISTD